MSDPLKNDSGNPATGTLAWDAIAVNSGSAGIPPAPVAAGHGYGLSVRWAPFTARKRSGWEPLRLCAGFQPLMLKIASIPSGRAGRSRFQQLLSLAAWKRFRLEWR